MRIHINRDHTIVAKLLRDAPDNFRPNNNHLTVMIPFAKKITRMIKQDSPADFSKYLEAFLAEVDNAPNAKRGNSSNTSLSLHLRIRAHDHRYTFHIMFLGRWYRSRSPFFCWIGSQSLFE